MIEAEDSLPLQATLFTPAGDQPAPAVLLLHMLGSSRAAWQASGLPQALADTGYVVLALDMRGHGASGGTRDWSTIPGDLRLVLTYLAEHSAVASDRIAIVGASIGANLALATGAADEAVTTVILLSPGLDYRGVTTEDKLEAYGQRPLLIVASQEDSYAAQSSEALAEGALGQSELLMFDGAGHGTNMFDVQPDLVDTIVAWLQGHV